jgi:hypothetical protein
VEKLQVIASSSSYQMMFAGGARWKFGKTPIHRVIIIVFQMMFAAGAGWKFGKTPAPHLIMRILRLDVKTEQGENAEKL